VELVVGTGDYVREAHRLQKHRHHDVGLDILANGHNGDVHIVHAQFGEDGFTRSVSRHGVGHLPHEGLNARLILVYRHYIMAELVKSARYTGSETAKADNCDLFFGCSDGNPRW
jgi:hypothetical protein